MSRYVDAGTKSKAFGSQASRTCDQREGQCSADSSQLLKWVRERARARRAVGAERRRQEQQIAVSRIPFIHNEWRNVTRAIEASVGNGKIIQNER